LHTNYEGSPSQLLSGVYSEYEWLPWKFERCPRNFWEDVNNQRRFMEWAGKQLNIKEMSDWYKVTTKDFVAVGGSGLVTHKYNNSLSLLLSKLYPHYQWLPWKFKLVPRNFWNEDKNKKKFMDWAGKQLGVKEISDWEKVSVKARQ
jgi:hypothetical protein